MLSDVMRALSLPPEFWSDLAGCSPKQLNEWAAGQAELPMSVAHKLSRATGVAPELFVTETTREEAAKGIPPLWLKAREDGLGETASKTLAVTRLLVSRYDEALSLLEEAPTEYRQLINEVRGRVDLQLPASKQGEVAADAFLKLTGLGQGARGIGEVFRGALRHRGLLVVETPIHDKKLEGFCVPVGSASNIRPCLLANSFGTTWFRRNAVLLHELGHAIFDLEGQFAVFDVSQADQTGSKRAAEERAESFAMHTLLPRRLLVAVESRGRKLAQLDSRGLAQVMAETHAEQRLIAKAALFYELVTPEGAERLRTLNISRRQLVEATPHARGLAGLDVKDLADAAVRNWESRKTTFPIAGVRLPIHFVKVVLSACELGKISTRKAAELLMVTVDDLATRYNVRPFEAA